MIFKGYIKNKSLINIHDVSMKILCYDWTKKETPTEAGVSRLAGHWTVNQKNPSVLKF
jgi:hypothetical protein